MIFVKKINSDLKGDGILLELMIQKPSKFLFDNKWDGIWDTFESLLASKICDYIPNQSSIDNFSRGLEKLNIPTDLTVKLIVYRSSGGLSIHLELENHVQIIN